jgi:hypothetical protein
MQTFALEQDVVQFPACKASGWPPLVLIRRCCGNPVAQMNSSQNASVLGATSWKVTLPDDASSAPPSAACLPPEHAPAITAATTNEPVRIECQKVAMRVPRGRRSLDRATCFTASNF